MNSGLKVLLNSCITSSLALSLLSKIYSLPRLDVIIMIVFLKSTVLPCPSVILPSSSICSSTLKTS